MIPTDGVIDQIGESRRIAHGKKRLIQFLSDNRHMSSLQLIPTFDSAFGDWQGSQKRRDDEIKGRTGRMENGIFIKNQP